MTQIHPCYSCKKDSVGGGSIVYGGMFFKMCAECLEDEDVLREMNNYWRKLEEEEYLKDIETKISPAFLVTPVPTITDPDAFIKAKVESLSLKVDN